MYTPKVSQKRRAEIGAGKRGAVRHTESTRAKLKERWAERKRLIELGRAVADRRDSVVDLG